MITEEKNSPLRLFMKKSLTVLEYFFAVSTSGYNFFLTTYYNFFSHENEIVIYVVNRLFKYLIRC